MAALHKLIKSRHPQYKLIAGIVCYELKKILEHVNMHVMCKYLRSVPIVKLQHINVVWYHRLGWADLRGCRIVSSQLRIRGG